MAHRAENDAVSDECDGIAGVGMTAKLAEVTSAAKAQEYPVGRHPRGRGVPTCTAQACAQVALDGGLCPAHRRAVKLTAEISDAVFHFFAGNRNIGRHQAGNAQRRKLCRSRGVFIVGYCAVD